MPVERPQKRIIKKFKPGNYGTNNGVFNRGKGTTIGGMYEAPLKRMCDFIFGDFFFGLEKDTERFVWVIFIREYVRVNDDEYIQVDKEHLKDFQDYWGKNFEIRLVGKAHDDSNE